MTDPPTRQAPEVLRANVFGEVPHGFLTRRGGVSTGWAAGLNAGLGSGDDRDAVTRNRALAAEAVLPGARLVGLHQFHSAECVTVADPWSDDARPRADALVTNRPNIVLGILTADCAPVLLADREAGVVGAAHAGWRGALAGVTDGTIRAMEALGGRAAAIVAAIGPCIGQESYEVDDAFRERFGAADSANGRFFTSGRPGHAKFDLEAYVAARLASAGVARVERLTLDTYSAPERFFSFRRATHLGESAYGRQISLIGLRKPG
ncbi:MAG: peptidoglycan editing factor PgeF [Novosphingobium sp.]